MTYTAKQLVEAHKRLLEESKKPQTAADVEAKLVQRGIVNKKPLTPTIKRAVSTAQTEAYTPSPFKEAIQKDLRNSGYRFLLKES